MKPLCHERAESIALTFSQNPTAPQMDIGHDNNNRISGSNTMLPIFGADSMREPQLEPSILGSIVPTLDPDPPTPPRNKISSAFNSDNDNNSGDKNSDASVAANDQDTPPATHVPVAPGSKRRFPAGSMPDGEPAPTDEASREWAGGDGGDNRMGGTASAEIAGARTGTAGHQTGSGRMRRPRVKHGLRVLLRGASRCGKTTILWDYCHRAAMAGHRVVLVCLRAANDAEGIIALPRSMRAGSGRGDSDELQGWEASALGRIGIKYVRSRDDLAWYLASLHTLKRALWPTVIAVDDVDKIIEASAGGGGGGSGGLGAAASRILALLQDTAEFFDNSRAETHAEASGIGDAADLAAAKRTAGSDQNARETPSKTTVKSPHANEEGSGGGSRGAGTTTPQPPPSGNLHLGSLEVEGGGGFVAQDWGARRAGVGPRGGVGAEEAGAVRVVSTCSTSDRGMLSLYGRFVQVVARVQNTTGPDCFSLKLEPGAGTAPQIFSAGPQARPAAGFAPGFTPWDGGSDGANADTGGSGSSGAGAGSPAARLEAVEFVRSQLDGSFALF